MRHASDYDDFYIVSIEDAKEQLETARKVRESITPLDAKKTLIVKIKQNESKIKKLEYKLRDIISSQYAYLI